jgi:hypothetical protein
MQISNTLAADCDGLDQIYKILALSEESLSHEDQHLLVDYGLHLTREELDVELRKVV